MEQDNRGAEVQTVSFKEAYDLPIGKHVKKKGKFSYLSWCYAVKHLRENYPLATWGVKENADGFPVFRAPCGAGWMVCVLLTIEGRRYPQWHPVLDNRNKPIEKPSAFDVNTSIHRCLTKVIGVATGIGLGLYAGEDLPTSDVVVERTDLVTDEQRKELQALVAATGSDPDKFLEYAQVQTFDDIKMKDFGRLKSALAQKEAQGG